jgi:hypothetical protein
MSKPHIADDHAAADQSPDAPGSHVRMRRDPAERRAAVLAERYGAGEISLEELVAGLKELAIGDGPRTAAEHAELRKLFDQLDLEPLITRLRNLGP